MKRMQVIEPENHSSFAAAFPAALSKLFTNSPVAGF
jgi:hypothetical protein